jgi:hypothetical protein
MWVKWNMKTMNDARPLTPSRYSVVNFLGAFMEECFSELLNVVPGVDRRKLGMVKSKSRSGMPSMDLAILFHLAGGGITKSEKLVVVEHGEVRSASSSSFCDMLVDHMASMSMYPQLPRTEDLCYQELRMREDTLIISSPVPKSNAFRQW